MIWLSDFGIFTKSLWLKISILLAPSLELLFCEGVNALCPPPLLGGSSEEGHSDSSESLPLPRSQFGVTDESLALSPGEVACKWRGSEEAHL